MVKCPICNGCMIADGSHFVETGIMTGSFVKWYCKFCKKHFVRKGRRLAFEEVGLDEVGEKR